MADGSVVIDALLNTDKFKGGIDNVIGQLKSIATTSEKSGTQTAKAIGQSMQSAGATMTKAVTLPLVGIGAASVATAATFEGSMSQVAATMGLTAEQARNGEQGFDKMKQAAMDMGAKTQFSASQAGEALNYLALAGYDSEAAVATLPVVLNLAAAGGMELATASDMVTDAMSALGLTSDDAAVQLENATRFTDQMAVTAQKSNTSVQQLGDAILTVGGTAKMLKGGTTELNAELGILADNGIKGAEGGTALRNIILSLTSPTDQAAAAMKQLGLEVFDNQGNMRSLDDIFQDLNGTLGEMNDSERTEVLSTLFNKVDLKSANALLANSGERFAELSGYIDASDGAAGRMAETMNDNLNGKLTQLGSAVEGAGITIGTALLPVITAATEFINGLVSAFNNLDPSIQTAIVVVGAVVAAIGPLLLILGSVISAVATIAPVAATAGAAFVSFATGPVGIVIAAIGAAIAILMTLYNNSETFRNFINGLPAFFGGVFKTIQNAFGQLGQNFAQGFTDMTSNASKCVEFIWNFFSTGLENIKQGFKQAEYNIGLAFSAIQAAGSAVGEFLSELFRDPFGTLKTAVTNIVSWVTSNFKLPSVQFPHIKLPHFNISGGDAPWGIMGQGTPPTIGIDWYAKGGYMNSATALGMNGDHMAVAGEAGAEGIVPLEGYHMYPLADAIAQRIGSSDDATAAIYSLMRELPAIIRKNTPDSLSVNEREFARLVRRV